MISYDCGHVEKEWCPGSDIHTPNLCLKCRQVLIGTIIHFVRFGHLPLCGLSYNHREHRYEDGVSCYLVIDNKIKNTIRCEFGARKKIIYGTATLVGFGGDDEPLIDAATVIRKRMPKKISAILAHK